MSNRSKEQIFSNCFEKFSKNMKATAEALNLLFPEYKVYVRIDKRKNKANEAK